jgi:hypothetical protein
MVMDKHDIYDRVTMVCAIGIILLCFSTCVKCQNVTTTPEPYDNMRWNGAGYFKTKAYLDAPDSLHLDWSNYIRTWDGKQFVVWGLFAATGVVHGMQQAYHADPYVFERKWGASEYGWWGSESWVRNYHGNDPDKPHKTELFGNFGRDVWHTTDRVHTVSLSLAISGTATRKHPIKYRIANAIIGMAVRSLFSNITYETLRHSK